jgi:hypothetical protein
LFNNNGKQIRYVVRDVRVLPFWGYAPDGRTSLGINCVRPPVRETFTDHAPASRHLAPDEVATVLINRFLS